MSLVHDMNGAYALHASIAQLYVRDWNEGHIEKTPEARYEGYCLVSQAARLGLLAHRIQCFDNPEKFEQRWLTIENGYTGSGGSRRSDREYEEIESRSGRVTLQLIGRSSKRVAVQDYERLSSMLRDLGYTVAP